MSSLKAEDQVSFAGKATTAADAISQVRNALKHLVGPEGLDIIPASAVTQGRESHLLISSFPQSSKTPHTTFKEADLHALSRVPLSTVRRKLSTALSSLLRAAAARESWEPGRADRLLHVKQDTVVKQRRLRISKMALAESRRLVLTADPFATPATLAFEQLRSVASSTGATTAEDSVESVVSPAQGDKSGLVKRKDRLLTICGEKFLADFTFYDVTAAEINVKVKFRHLADSKSNETGDADVDEDFAELLRKQDFDSLKTAFLKLMALEALSSAVSEEVSLIHALRCFEEDLIDAHHAEKKHWVSDDGCMQNGHGIVKRSALGLSITFMKDHTALLGVEDAIPAREISASRSHPTVRQDILSTSVPSTLQFQFCEAKMVSVHAQYVLLFDSPIIVCLSVAQNLERVGSGNEKDKLATTNGNNGKAVSASKEMFSSRVDVHPEDGTGKKQYWPSLQTLLAPVVFGPHERPEEDGYPRESQGPSLQALSKEVVKKREHWSQQATEFIAAASLPGKQYMQFSHSGIDTVSGLTICRVPLSHPKNVKPIFALIRQQIVFNELFKSCFASPIYPDKSRSGFLRQPVEVVLCDAPSFISLNLYDTVLDDILSVAIAVELGGDINVNLKLLSEKPHACSDAKAAAILRVCRSIPLTLMTVTKLGHKSSAARS